MKLCFFLIIPLFIVMAPEAAASDRFALQSNLDHVWTMVAAGLVFFMQAGFLLLESGLVRSKNSINVAQKNITDFIFSTMVFGGLGYMLMFGHSWGGVIGWDPKLFMFDSLDDWSLTFFVFQLVFCGTAATIISGATAERVKLEGYICFAILTGLIIYPVSGHWAWGNLLDSTSEPFLASWGFIDFAGSTVVHSVGAWISLAAIIIIGPRRDRFCEQGKLQNINGHSAVLATVGCLILWIGWIGFNGGSTTAGTSAFAKIIVNTIIAGAFGGMVQMCLGRFHSGLFKPEYSINGVLSGLVGITAGCDAVTVWSALMIGGSSSVVAFYGQKLLDHVFKLDDAIGAIPVHGFAGFWGTLMVGVFARPEALLANSHLDQFLIQLAGASIIFAWAFGVSFIFIWIVDRIWRGFPGGGFRVSEEDEQRGLNAAEHGATLGTGTLQEAMHNLAFGTVNLSDRINIETGDETGELAILFNKILERLESMETTRRRRRLQVEMSRRHLEDVIKKLTVDLRSVLDEQLRTLQLHSKVVADEANRIKDTSESARNGSSEIRSASSSSRESIDKTGEAAVQLSNTMQRIHSEISTTLNAMRDAAEQAVSTREAAEQLAIATSSIQKITEMIAAISSQTNMLALNAAIEASRAGEVGKGFAVVASGVKDLANQTSDATLHVTEQISCIRAVAENLNQKINEITQQLSSADAIAAAVADVVSNSQATTATITSDVSMIGERTTSIANAADGIGLTSENLASASVALGGTASEVDEAVTRLTNIFESVLAELVNGEEQRKFPRFDYIENSKMLINGASYEICIRNISIDGCMIDRFPMDFARGDQVELVLNDFNNTLKANIVAYSDSHINLQFAVESCDDDDLNNLINYLEEQEACSVSDVKAA